MMQALFTRIDATPEVSVILIVVALILIIRRLQWLRK
jgi:hypothetical protein